MRECEHKNFFDDDAIKFEYERWGYIPEGVADYNETEEFIRTAVKTNIRKLNFSCLELGSGVGTWVPFMRKLGCDVFHAIDISEQMLLRNNADELYQHDLNYGLPSELTQKYDVVLAIHSLEYINQLENLLLDIKEKMNPNGCIIIVTKNKYAYIWRMLKFIADYIANECIVQMWRSPKEFIMADMKVEVYGINVRIPTVINNVNNSFRLASHPSKLRMFINDHINRYMRKTIFNPFAWHMGLVISTNWHEALNCRVGTKEINNTSS